MTVEGMAKDLQFMREDRSKVGIRLSDFRFIKEELADIEMGSLFRILRF